MSCNALNLICKLENERFAKIYTAIAEKVSGRTAAVFGLIESMSKNGDCHASIECMAEILHTYNSRITEALDRLQDAGLILIYKYGRHHHNGYEITPKAIELLRNWKANNPKIPEYIPLYESVSVTFGAGTSCSIVYSLILRMNKARMKMEETAEQAKTDIIPYCCLTVRQMSRLCGLSERQTVRALHQLIEYGAIERMDTALDGLRSWYEYEITGGFIVYALDRPKTGGSCSGSGKTGKRVSTMTNSETEQGGKKYLHHDKSGNRNMTKPETGTMTNPEIYIYKEDTTKRIMEKSENRRDKSKTGTGQRKYRKQNQESGIRNQESDVMPVFNRKINDNANTSYTAADIEKWFSRCCV